MEISKEFSFEFGHRVHTQQPDELGCAPCRRLHGHSGVIEVGMEGKPDKHGMVKDFSYLGFAKQFIDNVLDHRFLIHHQDPVVTRLMGDKEITWNGGEDSYGYYEPEGDETSRELADSFIVVPFVPTSENICTWLLKRFRDEESLVSYIGFKETRKTYCYVHKRDIL